MKPSPAPWVEFETDDGDFGVYMNESHQVIFGNLEGSCGICHANARLTSLAPELLEIVEELRDLIYTGRIPFNLVGKDRVHKMNKLINSVHYLPNFDNDLP